MEHFQWQWLAVMDEKCALESSPWNKTPRENKAELVVVGRFLCDDNGPFSSFVWMSCHVLFSPIPILDLSHHNTFLFVYRQWFLLVLQHCSPQNCVFITKGWVKEDKSGKWLGCLPCVSSTCISQGSNHLPGSLDHQNLHQRGCQAHVSHAFPSQKRLDGSYAKDMTRWWAVGWEGWEKCELTDIPRAWCQRHVAKYARYDVTNQNTNPPPDHVRTDMFGPGWSPTG